MSKNRHWNEFDVTIPNSILIDKNLKPLDLRILIIIFSFRYIPEGEKAFSENYFRKLLGHDRETIRNSLKRLCDLEYIKQVREHDPKNHTAKSFVAASFTKTVVKKKPVTKEKNAAEGRGENHLGARGKMPQGPRGEMPHKDTSLKKILLNKRVPVTNALENSDVFQKVKKVFEYLNEKLQQITKDTYSPYGLNTLRSIADTFDTYCYEDLVKVIDYKFDRWSDNEKFAQNLTPWCLFGGNFPRYLKESNRVFEIRSGGRTKEEEEELLRLEREAGWHN